jgi:DNA-binding IclR family transcriptional regulator
MTKNDDRNTIKTATRLFRIIELIEEEDGIRLAELEEQIDIAKSTIHNYLTTLQQHEYIVKENGGYYLGLKLLDKGMTAKQRYTIDEKVKPSLDKLAQKTSETVWLFVEEHGKAVHLEKALGDDAVRTVARIGRRTHLHYHAAGKAILAFLPEHRIDKIIGKHGLPRKTKNTITDREELFEELSEIREQGYALNDEESVIGARAVGAPIILEDSVVGSISVTAPITRLNTEYFRSELPDQLLGITNEIELEVEYSNL